MQDKPLTTVPDAMRPAFDYSGLTDQTVEDLHFAEDEYRHGKQMAERGLVHMGNAIAAAHDALCGVVQLLDNSKHGNRGDDSFRAWCCSIGITKSTAYNLLQVSALMDGSSPRQQAILEALLTLRKKLDTQQPARTFFKKEEPREANAPVPVNTEMPLE